MLIRINNQTSQIVGDIDLVRDSFKYKVKGAEFTQLYKSGKWDGTGCPISKDGYFDSGLLHTIWQEFSFDAEDYRDDLPADPCFEVPGLELRDNQKAAISSCFYDLQGMPWGRGIIDAATNAGKTAMIIALTKSVTCDVVITIHNKEIFKQLVKALPGCGVVAGKKVEWKRVTVCMYKTLINRCLKSVNNLKQFTQAGAIISDECHRVAGDDYYKIMSKSNAYFRWGFSGTPLDYTNEERLYRVVGLFGSILYTIENIELIEKGYSARPKVKILDCFEPHPAFTYSDEYHHRIKFSKVRLQLIFNECVPGTLIVVENLDHADFIYEYIRKRLDGCIVLHGDMDDRDDRMSEFIHGDWPYVISTRVTQEGIDTPHIRCVIYAKGGKSVTGVKQFSGRGLRKKKYDNTLTIVDFKDHGRWISDHSQKRINIYKKEKFEFFQ